LGGKSNIGLKKETLLDVRNALTEIDRKDPKAFNKNIKTIELMLKVYDTAMADIEIYQGASTYAEIMRRDKRQQLRDSLAAIAGENTNAKNFYNNVLDSLIGGKPKFPKRKVSVIKRNLSLMTMFKMRILVAISIGSNKRVVAVELLALNSMCISLFLVSALLLMASRAI
jgi:hypothetical protein